MKNPFKALCPRLVSLEDTSPIFSQKKRQVGAVLWDVGISSGHFHHAIIFYVLRPYLQVGP
jgi:hypothetical protein